MSQQRTDGSKWIVAPQSLPPHQTGDLFGVWLKSGEEVDWIYRDNRVVGYTIVKSSNAQFVRQEVKP